MVLLHVVNDLSDGADANMRSHCGSPECVSAQLNPLLPFSPLQPTLTLQNSLLTRFPEAGEVSVTVQASNGRSMVQDTRTIRVYGNAAEHHESL